MKSRAAKAFALSNWLLLGNAAGECFSTLSVKWIKCILCLYNCIHQVLFDFRRQSLYSLPYFFFYSILSIFEYDIHKLKWRKPEQHFFGGFSFKTKQKRKKAWNRKYLYFCRENSRSAAISEGLRKNTAILDCGFRSSLTPIERVRDRFLPCWGDKEV